MTESEGTTLAPEALPPGQIPVWAKLFAFIAAATIVTGALGGAFGISWMRRLTLDAVDPVYIGGTLKKIADFGDTTGFHPVCAARFAGLSLVAFDEKAQAMQFDLFSYTSADSDPDPLEEIDQTYDRLAMFPGVTAKFVSINEKGKVDINGHQLCYQTGLMKDPKGESYKGVIACMAVGRKVLVVEGVAMPKKPLDLNLVIDFLRKAHSF